MFKWWTRREEERKHRLERNYFYKRDLDRLVLKDKSLDELAKIVEDGIVLDLQLYAMDALKELKRRAINGS